MKRAKLPSHLSVLVETWQGEPLSILLGLTRNSRDQLDVRVAEGAQVADGRRVWAFEETPEGVRFEDRVDHRSSVATVGTRLLAVHRWHAWVEGDQGIFRCDIRHAECRPGSVPKLPLDHPGPGAGFRVELANGTLRLFLPSGEEGVSLATGVARIIGVYWVRGATGEADTTLNRTFRGRARVHAQPRSVTVDGVLEDWASAAALVVDAPWQLQSGADGWSGDSDGSFSVAAAWTAEEVCFAGRVRDDHLVEGDRILIQVADQVEEIAVDHPSTWVTPGWWGSSWERCEPTAHLPALGVLPFAVSFVDHDPGQTTTILATAPIDGGVALGELVLDAPR